MKNKTWYSVKNKTNDEAVINIYDEIGMFGIDASSFVSDLQSVNAKSLKVHINSPGGSVFDGVAIYNALRDHKAKVHVQIDSLAASIASTIAMAGDTVSIHETAFVMIHKPWMLAIGDSDEMRKNAELLDKLMENSIKPAYKRKLGDKWDDEQITQLMADETWLNAEEALLFGFVDSIIEETDQPENLIAPKNWKKGFDSYNYQKTPSQVYNRFTPKDMTVTTNETEQNIVSGGFEELNINHSGPSGSGNINPNTEGETMPEEKKQQAAGAAPENKAPQVNMEEVKAELIKSERERVRRVRNLGVQLGVSDSVIESAIEEGIAVDAAIDKFTAIKKEEKPMQSVAQDVKVTMGKDERDNYKNVAIASLSASAGLPLSDEEKKFVSGSEAPKNLRGLIRSELRREGKHSPNKIDNMSSHEIGREYLRLAQNSISTGTGGLSNILADTINKALGVGYDESTATWPSWVPVQNVSDYKDFSLPKLSTFSDIEKIPEGHPFAKGAFSDKKESGAVSVYGRSLNISQQAITNDDLGAISRIPRAMGNAWAWFLNKLVYDELYGASGVGATLAEDSTAVFTTGHANYVASGSGGAPSVSTLATARKALRNQTAPKGMNADTARRLNLVARHLIVPSTLETTAEQVLFSNFNNGSAGSLEYNPFNQTGRNTLQLVVDAYLDSKTTTGWYLATEPSQMETIVMLALDGQTAPKVRSEESRVGEALGMNWDIYGAVAAMTADFRGLYYNYGS